MIFTAHFDETDTHGSAPTVILAAYLGHAYQWRRFETKLGRLQKRDNFTIFHATEFKARSGEFSGWSDEKCDRLIGDLTDLVRSNLTEGLAFALTRERYLNEYRAPPVPKKMNLDSQYGACFRACMGRLFDVMAMRDNRDRLNVAVERGHKNVGDCERIFNDLKDYLDFTDRNFLGEFTVAAKEDCPPLMMADLLAATYSMFRVGVGQGSIDPAAFQASPETKGRLALLELRPDALHDLKMGFEKMRQRKIDYWREQRVAKGASAKRLRLDR